MDRKSFIDNTFIDTQREVKTHRAACAIDDIIDDSKQALSMISWMAARREREEDKDTHRIALASLFHLICELEGLL